MNIKRFIARDMREAIRQVRETLGADAVILSNRTVEEGVEIIAAMDYDEDAVQRHLENLARAQTSAPAPAPAAPRAMNPAPAPTAVNRPTPSPRLREALDNARRQGGEARAESASVAASGAARPLPSMTSRPQPAPAPRVPMEAPSDEIARLRDEMRSLRSLFERQVGLLEWQHFGRQHPLRLVLLERLAQLGIDAGLAEALTEGLEGDGEPDALWQVLLDEIAARVPTREGDLVDEGGVMAFVGPTGVGKTTTVAKLAARSVLRYGRGSVALVTTDNFRIGAYDQLRNYARILDVPLHIARDAQELDSTLRSLADKRLVLVDTAGMSQRDFRMAEQLDALRSSATPIKLCLVLSANTQSVAQSDVIRRFARITLHGCVLTKVDEASSLGGSLSAVIRHELPLLCIGTGQRVPEDIEPAEGGDLVSRAVEMAQQWQQDYQEHEGVSHARRFAGFHVVG